MAIHFKSIEDLTDTAQMKAAIKQLRRQSKPAAFAFKARCEALGGEPLLILAPPGRRVDPGLLRQVRSGSRTVTGVVQREGQELVFTVEEQVSTKRMATLIAKVAAACKARIPRRRIRIVTPSTLPDAAEEEEVPRSPPAPEPIAHSTDLSVLTRQAEEAEFALETLRMDAMQWTVLSQSSAEAAQQAQEAVEAAEEALFAAQAQREALQRADDVEALIEATRALLGDRFDPTDPDTQAILDSVRACESAAEAAAIVAEWLDEEEEDQEWEVEALREELASRDEDAAQLSGLVTAVGTALVEAELRAARCQTAKAQRERDIARETLLTTRQAFLDAIATLEHASPDLAAHASLLADAEALFGAMSWIGKADRDRLQHARARFARRTARHESRDTRHEIREKIHAMESDIAQLMSETEAGSTRVATLEAKIRSQRLWLLDAVRDHVRAFPELSSSLRLLDRLLSALDHAEERLTELDQQQQEAEEREEEAAQRQALQQRISDATTELAADRAQRDPADTTRDNKPMIDLRRKNRHLHDELMEKIEATPALMGLLTELVLRIQRLEKAGAEELQILGEAHGPLTDLWEAMPCSDEPSAFARQLQAWRAREAQLWRLLGAPLEVLR